PKKRAEKNWHALQEWLTQHPSTEPCVAGVSPHAPYSVRKTLYSVLRMKAVPIATHLAETTAELRLLYWLDGPFVGFLKELGVWEPDGLVDKPRDVIRNLPRGIFVHCNYLDPPTPFTPTQTVVVSPRTHPALAHPHRAFP